MLIRIFHSGLAVRTFVFLLISLLLWLPAFLNPMSAITVRAWGIAYDYMFSVIELSPLAATIIAFLMVIFQAIYFNDMLTDNPVFSKSLFLPALLFVALMSYHPDFLTLHPALLANTFILFALRNLYRIYGKTEAHAESLNAGFWISFAALFYLPALYMLLLIWSAMIIYRISAWREWIISLIGVAAPFFLLWLVAFLTDNVHVIITYYHDNVSLGFSDVSLDKAGKFFWPVFAVVMMVAYAIFTLERSDKIISIRKYFALVNAYFLIVVATFFISGSEPFLYVFLLFPAASVIIAYYFIETKRVVQAELLFASLLLVIAIVKFI